MERTKEQSPRDIHACNIETEMSSIFSWNFIWSYIMRCPLCRSWLCQNEAPTLNQITSALSNDSYILEASASTLDSKHFSHPSHSSLVCPYLSNDSTTLGFSIGLIKMAHPFISFLDAQAITSTHSKSISKLSIRRVAYKHIIHNNNSYVLGLQFMPHTSGSLLALSYVMAGGGAFSRAQKDIKECHFYCVESRCIDSTSVTYIFKVSERLSELNCNMKEEENENELSALYQPPVKAPFILLYLTSGNFSSNPLFNSNSNENNNNNNNNNNTYCADEQPRTTTSNNTTTNQCISNSVLWKNHLRKLKMTCDTAIFNCHVILSDTEIGNDLKFNDYFKRNPIRIISSLKTFTNLQLNTKFQQFSVQMGINISAPTTDCALHNNPVLLQCPSELNISRDQFLEKFLSVYNSDDFENTKRILIYHSTKERMSLQKIVNQDQPSNSNSKNSSHNYNKTCQMWECAFCRKKIKGKRSNLTRHIAFIHEKRFGFLCNEPNCGLKFQSACNLQRHFNSIHLSRNHHCASCSRIFASRKALIKHIDSVHYKVSEKFRCHHCGGCYCKRQSLDLHIKAIHSEYEKQ